MLTGLCHNGGLCDYSSHPMRSVAILIIAPLLIVSILRSPLTLQQPSQEQPFNIPDVLGERMVIPPNTPDWVLFNCKDKTGSELSQSLAEGLTTVFGQKSCREEP